MRCTRIHSWLVLIIFLLIFHHPLAGQNIFPSSLQFNQREADSVVVQARSIPYADISPRSNETFNLVTESLKQRLTEAEISDFTVQIDTLIKQINTSLNDSVLNSIQNLPARVMDNYMNTVQIYIVRLTAAQNRLSLRSRRLVNVNEELNHSRKRWQLTLEQAEEEDFPDVLSDRIKITIDTIDYARTSVQQDIEFLIIQSDRISREINKLESVRSSINEYILLYGQNLFKKDIPGLFRSFSDLKDKTLLQERLQSFSRTIKSDVQIFHAQFRKSFLFMTIIFILLLGFLVWYKKNYLRLISARKSRLSDNHLMLIHSPLLIALFITTLLIRLLYYDLPDTFNALNSIIFIIPVMILARRFYGELTRPWLKWFMVLFIIIALYEFIFSTDIIQRIILLILSAGAFGLFLAMVLNRSATGGFGNKSFYNLLLAVMGAFTIMLFTAIIGNIAGTYRMAELFTLAPIKIVITALAILISSKIADALIFNLLANKGVQKAHVFRDNFKVIHKKTTRYVNIFLWVIFILTMLNLLMIKEPVFTWLEKVLKEGWKFGAVDISLGRILIFIFVIWFSIFISRIVQAILEKDVFTRVTTSRGVPGTITMLVRIALITGGFFLAAAAAGMKLTNLSIVLGAFSVGIGFGLQNIFNNMVSGLILAFERPIKVGDTVQVGELTGIVKSIGFRSSTIRSFDGAEVIVPNGNLISNEMINWTLSDSFRRMDIRVGVAYGTNPEVVLDLIRQAAEENENVSKEPPPKAYFIGFGDSSLDFRLLAWTDIGNRLAVESDLTVAINRKIVDAGIEIPFPQRDLHIRSDFRKSE